MKSLLTLKILVFALMIQFINSANAQTPDLSHWNSSVATHQDKPDPYHSIGGTVFAGQYPLAVFDASLIALYMGDYLFVDWEHFDTLGYYYFINIPESQYMVKAEPIPGTPECHKYIPTYTGNAMHWQQAMVPFLNVDIFNADIHLIETTMIPLGTGEIQGHLDYFNKDMGMKAPVSDAEILLKNPQGAPLGFINTDFNGHFMFPELPWGAYVIFPEIEGRYTTPFTVYLDQNHQFANVAFNLDGENIYAGGISSAEENSPVFSSAYPMPAGNTVSVDYAITKEGESVLSILDLTGRLVLGPFTKEIQGNGTLSINVDVLATGMYLMQIDMEGQSPFVQKVQILR